MQEDEKRWQESGQQGSDYGRQEGELGGDTGVAGEGDLGGDTAGQTITGAGEDEMGQPSEGMQDESGHGTEAEDSESTGATGPGF